MGVYPGTYIPTGIGSSAKFIHLIDDLMTPRLMGFRQIHIDDEPAQLNPDGVSWFVTFGNWLNGEAVTIRKNGMLLNPNTEVSAISYQYGTFQLGVVDIGGDRVPRDTVDVNYVFDFFPAPVLEGFLTSAVSTINMTAVGPPTSYTVNTAPTNWEGVMVDIAFAMCMEKLLLDYNLWRYRLIFAVGPNEVYGGGGDIASQLTTLKQNAEQRADKAMDNQKFKTGNYISPPTSIYYASIRGAGGGGRGGGTMPFSGRLRGWKPNKWA